METTKWLTLARAAVLLAGALAGLLVAVGALPAEACRAVAPPLVAVLADKLSVLFWNT